MKVLLFNDDGPPSPNSPFVDEFWRTLTAACPAWDISVVLPHINCSWIGKALTTSSIVETTYYDPYTCETSTLRKSKTDFTLLSCTPGSCANIALYHIYKDVDLIISGPNAGRNSSCASTLSSGTIGAALEGSFFGCKAISVSFGYFDLITFKDPRHVSRACRAAVGVIQKLWSDWDTIPNASPMFNVNIPLIAEDYEGVSMTTFSKGDYLSLYKPQEDGSFKFAPTFDSDSALPGSDTYAIFHKQISVTPFYASLVSDLELEKYRVALVFDQLINESKL